MACKQVMKERQKRTATGPSQGLKALHDKLAKTYKYRSLHARLIELQLPLQGDSDNVVEIVVRVRVDAPKCPLCSKHVLELVVQETLQQELVAKHAMLRDAELVVVDKDYNILSASLPPASAGAQGDDGQGSCDFSNDDDMTEGVGRGRTADALARAHVSRPPLRGLTRQGPAESHALARHEGVIRRVLVNKQGVWYGFVDAPGITPENGLYCVFERWKPDLKAWAPQHLRHDDDAVREWLRLKRLIFSVADKGMDNQTGLARKVGEIHQFPDLRWDLSPTGADTQGAGTQGALAPAGTHGGGMPHMAHAPLDMAAGDASTGARRAPKDPRIAAQDARREAVAPREPPKDPRVQLRAPSDPRLLRPASARLVGGEGEEGGGVSGSAAGGNGGEGGYGGTVGMGGGEAAPAAAGHARQEAGPEKENEKVAWLLTHGSYLCKMCVHILPVPHPGGGRGGSAASSLLQQALCLESPCIDLTHSVCIKVPRGG